MRKTPLVTFYLPSEHKTCDHYYPREDKIWCSTGTRVLRVDRNTGKIDKVLEVPTGNLLPLSQEELLVIPTTGSIRTCTKFATDDTVTELTIDLQELYSDGYREHIPIKFLWSQGSLVAARLTRKNLSLLNLSNRDIDVFDTLDNMPNIENVIEFSFVFATSWESREDGIFVSIRSNCSVSLWDILARKIIRLRSISGPLGSMRMVVSQRSSSPRITSGQLLEDSTYALPVLGTYMIRDETHYQALTGLKPTDVPGIFVQEYDCDVEDTRVELSQVYFRHSGSKSSTEIVEDTIRQIGQCNSIMRFCTVVLLIIAIVVLFYFAIKDKG